MIAKELLDSSGWLLNHALKGVAYFCWCVLCGFYVPLYGY